MINEGLVATAKLASTILVSSGVSTMVGYAAKSSVPKVVPYTIRHIPLAVKGWKVFQKIAIPAGAAALAGMASEQAVRYADRKIDENVAMVNQLQKNLDEKFNKKSEKDSDSESEEA